MNYLDETEAASSVAKTGFAATSRCPTRLDPRTSTSTRISTIESLREHLQWAMELEHCTLPPYLCALYSLNPDRNPESVEVMVSVLVEEMLHMALVANILNAVGGRPRLDAPEMLAPFPRCLPHGDRSFEIPLVPFGREAIDVFLKIEQPARPTLGRKAMTTRRSVSSTRRSSAGFRI